MDPITGRKPGAQPGNDNAKKDGVISSIRKMPTRIKGRVTDAKNRAVEATRVANQKAIGVRDRSWDNIKAYAKSERGAAAAGGVIGSLAGAAAGGPWGMAGRVALMIAGGQAGVYAGHTLKRASDDAKMLDKLRQDDMKRYSESLPKNITKEQRANALMDRAASQMDGVYTRRNPL